jgi:Domain of unknown function (DUF4214)
MLSQFNLKQKITANCKIVAASLALALLPATGFAETVTDNLVVFSGVRGNFQIERTPGGFKITDTVGQEGSVEITNNNVRLQFADKSVALDLDGHAGQAYRLYQSALNRTPDAGGLGFWIDRLDRDTALRDIAAGFITSPEFISTYGSDSSPEAFIDKIYTNILRRAPDAGGAAYWVDVIKKGAKREDVLAFISESTENINRVNDTLRQGIEFDAMPVASAASGLWEGNTADGRKMVSVILDNGVFWTLYSPPNQPNSVDGVITGYGKVAASNFNSTKAYEFNINNVKAIQHTEMHSRIDTTQKTLNGSFSALGGKHNVDFTTQFNASLTQAAPLSALAGTYVGVGLQHNSVALQTLKIESDGKLSSTALNSCRISGTVSARNNINAYSVAITFGPAPCKKPNSTVNGIGFYDSDTRQFFSIGINGERNDGFVFAGAK